MKKLTLPLLFSVLCLLSCSSLKGYLLTDQDAAAAIRQMLELGARDGLAGAFSRDAVMASLFPEPLRKTLNTLQTLGLSNEIDRFTTTLSTAAEKTAANSVPIFINGIRNMSVADAVRIVKNGGTSATDYLRTNVGTEVRQSIKPVMQSALEEYKLNEQWNKIIKPAKALVGDKLNLDLSTVMAGLVAQKMFDQIALKETQVRTTASARTTDLLQKVFSKSWN